MPATGGVPPNVRFSKNISNQIKIREQERWRPACSGHAPGRAWPFLSARLLGLGALGWPAPESSRRQPQGDFNEIRSSALRFGRFASALTLATITSSGKPARHLMIVSFVIPGPARRRKTQTEIYIRPLRSLRVSSSFSFFVLFVSYCHFFLLISASLTGTSA